MNRYCRTLALVCCALMMAGCLRQPDTPGSRARDHYPEQGVPDTAGLRTPSPEKVPENREHSKDTLLPRLASVK